MFQRLVFLLVLLAAATASAQNEIAPNPTISAPVTGPGAMFPGLQRVPAGTGLADQKSEVRRQGILRIGNGERQALHHAHPCPPAGRPESVQRHRRGRADARER